MVEPLSDKPDVVLRDAPPEHRDDSREGGMFVASTNPELALLQAELARALRLERGTSKLGGRVAYGISPSHLDDIADQVHLKSEPETRPVETIVAAMLEHFVKRLAFETERAMKADENRREDLASAALQQKSDKRSATIRHWTTTFFTLIGIVVAALVGIYAR